MKTSQRTVPKIPDGLVDLMKNLAKSVLKEQPENIYLFAAEYFENLVLERDGSLDKGYSVFRKYEEELEKRRDIEGCSRCRRLANNDGVSTTDDESPPNIENDSPLDMSVNGVAIKAVPRNYKPLKSQKSRQQLETIRSESLDSAIEDDGKSVSTAKSHENADNSPRLAELNEKVDEKEIQEMNIIENNVASVESSLPQPTEQAGSNESSEPISTEKIIAPLIEEIVEPISGRKISADDDILDTPTNDTSISDAYTDRTIIENIPLNMENPNDDPNSLALNLNIEDTNTENIEIDMTDSEPVTNSNDNQSEKESPKTELLSPPKSDRLRTPESDSGLSEKSFNMHIQETDETVANETNEIEPVVEESFVENEKILLETGSKTATEADTETKNNDSNEVEESNDGQNEGNDNEDLKKLQNVDVAADETKDEPGDENVPTTAVDSSGEAGETDETGADANGVIKNNEIIEVNTHSESLTVDQMKPNEDSVVPDNKSESVEKSEHQAVDSSKSNSTENGSIVLIEEKVVETEPELVKQDITDPSAGNSDEKSEQPEELKETSEIETKTEVAQVNKELGKDESPLCEEKEEIEMKEAITEESGKTQDETAELKNLENETNEVKEVADNSKWEDATDAIAKKVEEQDGNQIEVITSPLPGDLTPQSEQLDQDSVPEGTLIMNNEEDLHVNEKTEIEAKVERVAATKEQQNGPNMEDSKESPESNPDETKDETGLHSQIEIEIEREIIPKVEGIDEQNGPTPLETADVKQAIKTNAEKIISQAVVGEKEPTSIVETGTVLPENQNKSTAVKDEHDVFIEKESKPNDEVVKSSEIETISAVTGKPQSATSENETIEQNSNENKNVIDSIKDESTDGSQTAINMEETEVDSSQAEGKNIATKDDGEKDESESIIRDEKINETNEINDEVESDVKEPAAEPIIEHGSIESFPLNEEIETSSNETEIVSNLNEDIETKSNDGNDSEKSASIKDEMYEKAETEIIGDESVKDLDISAPETEINATDLNVENENQHDGADLIESERGMSANKNSENQQQIQPDSLENSLEPSAENDSLADTKSVDSLEIKPLSAKSDTRTTSSLKSKTDLNEDTEQLKDDKPITSDEQKQPSGE